MQLALCEIEQSGRDSFAEPDYASIYGLTPRDWYARGVHILRQRRVAGVDVNRGMLGVARSQPPARVAVETSSAAIDRGDSRRRWRESTGATAAAGLLSDERAIQSSSGG